MQNWLSRTEWLLGEKGINKLKNSRIAVIGLGGVGGSAAEGLVRAGVGSLILMDRDTISETNINRQLLATGQTVGTLKTQAAKERFSSICPKTQLLLLEEWYTPETSERLFSQSPDFIIDAIDTVSFKIHLLRSCHTKHIPSISCMGTGNRLDPTQFTVGSIEDTKGTGCGLAKVMRKELKKYNLNGQKVVYSKENPLSFPVQGKEERHPPGSLSCCPPVAGYILASYAISFLLSQ